MDKKAGEQPTKKPRKPPAKQTLVPQSTTPDKPPAPKLADKVNAMAESKGILSPPPPAEPGTGGGGDFDPVTEAKRLNIWRLNQGGGSFFVPAPEKGNNWIVYNGGELKLELKAQGISCAKPEDGSLSRAQRLVHYIQSHRTVEAHVEALAGFRAGVHNINERRVLVRSNYKLVEPCAGEFPTLKGLIECNLKPANGRDLCPYFYAWLKVAFESLRENTFQTGQILYLIGPPGCGKSRLQNQIITPLLGGRSADPSHFLTGRTNFNEDLTAAEHLQVEDPDISATFEERNFLGKRLKQFAANDGQTLQPKGSKGFKVKPFWRVSVSQNDDQTSLDMIPPMEVVGDKMILLRCQPPDPDRFRLPVTKDEREKFREDCAAELPAFAAWLLNWQISEEHASERYGVASFIDPWVTREICAHSRETALLECIDKEVFQDEDPLLNKNWVDQDTWKGNSTELAELLCREASSCRRQAVSLFKSNSMVLGKLLTSLSHQQPDRVKVAPRRAETNGYFLCRPKPKPENATSALMP